MGQYKDLVEHQKLVLKAEAWAKEVKYILAEGDTFTVAYNDGSKKISNSAGTTITDATLSTRELIWRMKELEADAKR
jgi:hypothetical protein